MFLRQEFTQPIFTEHPPSVQHCDRFYLGLQWRTDNTSAREAQSPIRDRRMDIQTAKDYQFPTYLVSNSRGADSGDSVFLHEAKP